MPIYYISPRDKRHKKRPFRLQNGRAGGGHAALLASIVGQAQNDFLAGDAEQYLDARLYFRNEYQQHAEMLNLAPGVFPNGIRAVEIQEDDDTR